MDHRSSMLTVFVPAYNEESGLRRNIELLSEVLAELQPNHEILIVDDCSSDSTAAIADALADQHTDVRVVHHPTNRGIGGGMVTAIDAALGEWLILIPADLALDLAELGKYLEAADSADVVVGVRSDRSDYSGFRLVVSWFNICLIQLLFGMRLRQFNYISLYRVALLREMRVDYWRSAFFFAEILIKARTAGYRLVEVDIRYEPRSSGQATGSNPGLIGRTVRDMLHFWWRVVRRDSDILPPGSRTGTTTDGDDRHD